MNACLELSSETQWRHIHHGGAAHKLIQVGFEHGRVGKIGLGEQPGSSPFLPGLKVPATTKIAPAQIPAPRKLYTSQQVR